jgi:outer membrane lipoprotein carrier protein
VKKPSRVRFTYEAPERKVFVSDGSQFYSYFPADRTGSVQPLPKDDEASTALLFLAGRGNLTRDFTASIPAKVPAGEWHLLLAPKKPQADFETLTLILDPATLALRGFITTDEQGTNTVRFSNLRENAGVADNAFAFQFPKGTEIIK